MCRLFLMTIASLMVLFGISGFWMMPKLIQQKIEQRMQLKIGTKTMDRFTKVPIPLTVKFYIFNVTNSEQVLAGLERPKFQEVGPFIYKQWRRRHLVDFEDYNRRLRYREYKTFYPMFESTSGNLSSSMPPEEMPRESPTTVMNNGQRIGSNQVGGAISRTGSATQKPPKERLMDPNDYNVTIINVPLLSVLTKLAQLEEGSLKRNLAARVAGRLIKDGNDKILVSRRASEILFDGYKVDFMESARGLVSETLGFNFESPLPQNKFGFFYLKNGTWNRKENGELTVFTGRNESMNDFMLVENWNDLRQLNVWPTNTEAGNKCNQIKGTDGSQFHPGLKRDQRLHIFSPMICRSLYIRYKHETQVRDIPLWRYQTDSGLFGAPRKYPENACFCTIPRHETNNVAPTSAARSNSLPLPAAKITDSRCYLDGLLDLSLCQKGAPIAASAPHFLGGDPLLAMAAGTKPDPSLHQTYIDIEPMTGAVMRAASRAQLNAYVEKAALEVVDSSIVGHMEPMVAPLLWLEEAAEIDEKSSREFKSQLLNLVQKAKRSFYLAIILGIILALAVAVQCWFVACYKPDRKSIKLSADEKPNQKGRKVRTQRIRPIVKKPIATGKVAGQLPVGHMAKNLRLAKEDPSRKSLAEDRGVGGDDGDDDEYRKPLRPPPSDSGGEKGRTGSGISSATKLVGAAALLGVAAGAASSGRNQRSRTANYDRPEVVTGKEPEDHDETDGLMSAVFEPSDASGASISGSTGSTPSINAALRGMRAGDSDLTD